MGLEGPPGGSREMVWVPCPECSGTGQKKDSAGNSKPCGKCWGKGQIKTR